MLTRNCLKISGLSLLLLVCCVLQAQKDNSSANSNNLINAKDTLQTVIVNATRAGEKTPTTYTNLSKEEIESRNLGVDVPYLLDFTPSAVVTSDAGTGIGYTGIRIRGTDPSRINVQINGIPLNDSESQGVFWVDLPDFATSVNNIQIQRGVGTSVNGAGAFGASIDLATNKANTQPYGSIGASIGSFNTYKGNVSFGTGLINKHWTFDGRLSTVHSDGYIDRGRADLNSYFVSAGYLGKKSSVKLNVFSGHEITYQAWYGVPLSELNKDNYTYNPSGIHFDEEGNAQFHEDEVDNYRQTHAQLHYNQSLNTDLSLNLALHYTKGQGYFEQYKEDDDLADYGIADIALSGDTITSSDIIRRRWLDNDFYGAVLNLKYQKNKLSAVLGGGANNYLGGHYGEVIWSRYAGNSSIYDRYYDNDAEKSDVNVFAKANYQITDAFNVFADAQMRFVNYSFLGIAMDNDGGFLQLDRTEKLSFFNPKLGATYSLNDKNQVYASWAVGQREPNRSDYVDAPANQTPKSEKLNDFELGYRANYNKSAFSANVYYMLYKDQLALNGGVNDVGEYTRINIPESYRLGLELVGGLQITNWLDWQANLTLSQNKVKAFTEKVDAYNPPDYGLVQIELNYENTDLAFSPNIIGASNFTFNVLDNDRHRLEASLMTKYVGKQFIDNTSNGNANLADFIEGTGEDITYAWDDGIAFNDRFLEAYLTNDIRLAYGLKNIIAEEIALTFWARNILDQNYISNAYAYRYVSDNILYEGEGYFPQAGRNYLLGLEVKF